MNLLKQTALVLGLSSLSIFAWTLYRSWRKKIAIEFAVICIMVAIWSLSFVAHATLNSRLAYDIHRVFNIWLAPLGVLLLSRFLVNEDQLSKWLKRASFAGAIILSLMVTFSVESFYDSSEAFRMFVRFWPITVCIQFVSVIYQDTVLKRPVNLEFLSPRKRNILYLGVFFALTTCTFDHIPELGYVIPSVGNLLFTIFLVFASQVVSPQKFLRAEALASRFFATLIVALVITGFFALLYQYVSDSFPLFLLNSFLLSFATLVLWSPLVTLFRYLAQRFFRSQRQDRALSVERFKDKLSAITNLKSLESLIQIYFKKWIDADAVQFLILKPGMLSPIAQNFFLKNTKQSETPILHRQLIQLEADQELTQEFRTQWEALLQFLDENNADIAFPVLGKGMVQALVLVKMETSPEETPAEWSLGFAYYTQIYSALQDVAPVLERLVQFEEAKETERLVLLGEMAAGLAHEVRNPLGAIRGAAELLDDSQWARVIKEEVQRLNRLVSQFLDLSQAPKPGNLETCDLISVIMVSLKNMQFPLKQAHLPDMEVKVQANADQIQQILINLIQNALQASDVNNANQIQVQWLDEKRDGRNWTGFEVVDKGKGIPEQDLPKVFQPFYTTFKEGTGLGLSICNRLAKLNGGMMEIHSRVNEGTTVKVYLPYAG